MTVTFKKLSEFLREKNIKVEIDNNVEYKCGGVRLNGRGVFVREIKLGSDIQKQWVMHRVRKNDVIYSTLFADKGAFAIAKSDDEELIFSEKFVCFEITDKNVLPEYLHVIFQSDYLSSQCNEFKTGMAAFSLAHSSKKKVLKLSIPIPDLDTQKCIVSEYASYEKLRTALDEQSEVLKTEVNILKQKFISEELMEADKIKLSELGSYINRPIELFFGKQYKQITVKLHGNGVVLRKTEDGGNIKSKQFQVKTNDLIYSKIDVKSGAIGFIPPELNDGIVTSDFPIVQTPDLSEVDRTFMMIYFSSEQFCSAIEEKSKGTTNRVRAKKSSFLENLIPWGTTTFRKDVVTRYRSLCTYVDAITKKVSDIQDDIPTLTSKYLNILLGIE